MPRFYHNVVDAMLAANTSWAVHEAAKVSILSAFFRGGGNGFISIFNTRTRHYVCM
jgi:hypothetical protein